MLCSPTDKEAMFIGVISKVSGSVGFTLNQPSMTHSAKPPGRTQL